MPLPSGFIRCAATLECGRELHYVRGNGNGKPIVFLHGAGGPRVSPAMREACNGRPLLVPVYPGFGTPAYDDVRGARALARFLIPFIDMLAGPPCDLIAHSLGGHVALWLSAERPDLVGRMVLECPAGFRDGPRPLGEARTLLYAHPERIPKEPQYEVQYTPPPETASRYRAAGVDHELWERLLTLEAQVLLVHGRDDKLIDPAISTRLANCLRNATLETLDGCGHAIEIDQPDTFVRVVRHFFNRSTSTAHDS